MAYVCMDNLLCDEVWLSKSSNTFEEVSDPVALKSYEKNTFSNEQTEKQCKYVS